MVGNLSAIGGFTVDCGSANGIQRGDTVVSDDGYLVGTVQEVDVNSCKVLTILHPGFSAAAVVSRTRDNGILCGDSAYADQGLCTMTNLSGRAQQPFHAYDDNTHVLSMYALHPLIAPPTATDKTESVIGSLYWDEELGLMYRTWNDYSYVDSPVLEVRQGSLEQQTLGPEILLYTRGQDIPLVAEGTIPIDSYIRSDAESVSLLPFMTPTPTALPMATVPPTLEPGNSATLPPHTTPDPAAHTDRTQSTMMNHTDDLMLQKTLQPIITYREATSSDMAGSTSTPQPTAAP